MNLDGAARLRYCALPRPEGVSEPQLAENASGTAPVTAEEARETRLCSESPSRKSRPRKRH
jgi:hypothetical protein